MSESENGIAEARAVPSYLQRVAPIAARLRAIFWRDENCEPTPAEAAEFAEAVDEACIAVRRARKAKSVIGGNERSGRRNISPREKRRVLTMNKNGHSQRSIARATKLDRKTIAKILRNVG